MKLILIEDQAMIRQMLTMACQQALPEVKVLSAANGLDALELCTREQPKLVLLDLVLPDCDGLDLVPKLRAAVPGVKILVVSSDISECTIYRAQKAEVEGFVDKNKQAIHVLQEALASVLMGQPYYCSSTQSLRARMRADPKLFSKILSDREIELLGFFGQGQSNDDIAAKMDLRSNTVRNHRQNIMTKLGLCSTTQLIHYALDKGFIRYQR